MFVSLSNVSAVTFRDFTNKLSHLSHIIFQMLIYDIIFTNVGNRTNPPTNLTTDLDYFYFKKSIHKLAVDRVAKNAKIQWGKFKYIRFNSKLQYSFITASK